MVVKLNMSPEHLKMLVEETNNYNKWAVNYDCPIMTLEDTATAIIVQALRSKEEVDLV